MGLTRVTDILVRDNIRDKLANGEVVYVIDEKTFYLYNDGNFTKIPTDTDLKLSLYDMNAQVISQLPTLSEEKLNNKNKDFKNFIKETNNNFYMLYGKEISYFTVFHNLDPYIGYIGYQIYTDFYEVLLECLRNIGEVKSFDLTEAKDAFEIWVKIDEDKTTCLYFFPYDTGIVYVQEGK